MEGLSAVTQRNRRECLRRNDDKSRSASHIAGKGMPCGSGRAGSGLGAASRRRHFHDHVILSIYVAEKVP